MADTQTKEGSIFRQSAMSRIASADDLDKYIKVTNPSAWAILLAAVLLLAGLGIWSATAVLPTTTSVTGIASKGTVYCWVDEGTADRIREGSAKAQVGDDEATNIQVNDIPLSDAEIRSEYGSDYLSTALTLNSWNYEVVMEVKSEATSSENARLVPVEITVSEKHPLDLVLSRN